MKKTLEGLATITEVANLLPVARGTLRGAISAGYITTLKTAGGTTLVDIKSARKWHGSERLMGRKAKAAQ
ncbi:unnamed protein product [marine sediment metagenome]|uniref:Helix-turn-helix domain-containing protein n=1 Tax=marine sediment metagenome TaxID=412755 RepID=X0V195_9ZZZZ